MVFLGAFLRDAYIIKKKKSSVLLSSFVVIGVEVRIKHLILSLFPSLFPSLFSPNSISHEKKGTVYGNQHTNNLFRHDAIIIVVVRVVVLVGCRSIIE